MEIKMKMTMALWDNHILLSKQPIANCFLIDVRLAVIEKSQRSIEKDDTRLIRAFYLYFFLSRRQETFDVYYLFAFLCAIKTMIKLLKLIVRGESWKKKSIKNKIFVRDTESPSFDPFIRSRLFLVARFSSWKIEEKNARTSKELEARSLDFWNTSPALFCSYRALNC